MIFRKVVALAFAAASVAGCNQTTGDAGPREGVGTVAGAVAGGLIGSSLGGRGGARLAGGLIGAVAGGMVGNAIGRGLDDQARREAAAAEYRALESGGPGAPVAWRSRQYYGTVTPGPDYERDGYSRCREFAHTIYIDGKPETARGVACRQSDGNWVPV
jgi:surface antigen